MEDFDLLEAVLPDDGYYAVVGIKENKPVHQILVQSREEFDAAVEHMLEMRRNVFFGVAKYETSGGRTKENVKSLKAVWLDIDCGPEKAREKDGRPQGYETQELALVALERFCKTVGLPRPIIVNSGRGLHVYWTLNKELSREEWEPLAQRLRDLCFTQGLYVDANVFDASRILRVPGTFNFKGEEPLEVGVVAVGKPLKVGELRRILGVETFLGLTVPTRNAAKSYLSQKLADDRVNLFSKILARTNARDGCNQLGLCIEGAADLPEPRWFNALSIAKFCADREEGYRAVSEGHPDFDLQKVIQKASHILGPHTCASFETNNPNGCSGCPHKGKIKSPIVLGAVVEGVPPEANFIIEEPPEEAPEQAPEVYHVPEYPFPFFRGKTGGIYLNLGEEEQPILIYPHDFYVHKRMNDPNDGEVTVFRRHLPHDGMREFCVTNAKVTDAAELRKALSANGVVVSAKNFGHLVSFIIGMINEMQVQKGAEEMRLQFGWADKDRKFIIGEKEISAGSIAYSPPSSATVNWAKHLHTKGTLEVWKDVFNLYGRPGLEPVAFAALVGFGGPLFRFSGQKGLIINMVHPRSGTGKTTALRMMNSIWGQPDVLCGRADDTVNARTQKLGVMNHIPPAYDEMTNIRPEHLSDFAYSATHGAGKDRMKASSNEMRHNATTWQTMVLTSSNSSFYERLGVHKHSADGETMRIVEYKVGFSDAIDRDEGKNAFDNLLLNNYGHAGIIYAQYILQNFEAVREEYLTCLHEIDMAIGAHQNERFRSAGVAAALTGGRIAKRLGLIDWNIDRISNWAISMLRDIRSDAVSNNPDGPIEAISYYVNRHITNMLIVNAKAASEPQPFPAMEPRGPLLMRFEPNTNRLFIMSKALQEDFVKHQINYRDTLDCLKRMGVLMNVGSKRLGSGLKGFPAPAIHCVELDTNNAFFGEMLQELTQDAEQTKIADEEGV